MIPVTRLFGDPVLASLAALLALLAAPLAAPMATNAAEWQVLPEESSITFSGTHAGQKFSGRFARWTGTVTFDPAALEQARARIVVDLASATTGDATYDGTMPKDDWFSVDDTPKGIYETIGFTAKGDDRYGVSGTLTIRGHTVPVALDAEIRIVGDRATMSGTAVVNRMDYEIGASSDASGAWVSLEIPLDLKVAAERVP